MSGAPGAATVTGDAAAEHGVRRFVEAGVEFRAAIPCRSPTETAQDREATGRPLAIAIGEVVGRMEWDRGRIEVEGDGRTVMDVVFRCAAALDAEVQDEDGRPLRSKRSKAARRPVKQRQRATPFERFQRELREVRGVSELERLNRELSKARGEKTYNLGIEYLGASSELGVRGERPGPVGPELAAEGARERPAQLGVAERQVLLVAAPHLARLERVDVHRPLGLERPPGAEGPLLGCRGVALGCSLTVATQ